jgi:predicted metal-dependent peptidase
MAKQVQSEVKVVIGGKSQPTSYKHFAEAQNTSVRLMLRFPWLMGLYYSMTIFEETSDLVPTLATNGTSMWVNPHFWHQLDRDQKMTAFAHEVGHKMYLHPSRRGDRDPIVWNIAGDHRINLDLVESGFKPLQDMTIDGKPWSWFCDAKYNDPKPWTTEAIYEDVYQQLEDQCKKQTGMSMKELAEAVADAAARAIGQAGDLVDFGNTPNGTPEDSSSTGTGRGAETLKDFEFRVGKELRESEQVGQMAGNCPAWMKRAIAVADHQKVNWFDVYEQYLKAMTIADYSWSRFSRREFVKTGVISPDVYQPAMGGMKFYIDCSGSIDAVTLGKFEKHVKDVLEQVKPKWVEISYFETVVHHSHDQRFERGEFEVMRLNPIGGGGTAVTWLKADLESMEEAPEVVTVLTDMHVGGMGREPDVPVIWLSTTDISTAAYGTVININ